ncbi:MAG: molybdopterin molybdotransferase MoeA [Alteraurantiacibacter sp.]
MNLPPLLPFDEAQARLLAMANPLGAESVPVGETAGRYLAEPLVAQRTRPWCDLSAMDGYAMRGDDLDGPWRVVGESRAGAPYDAALAKGQTARISTGAAMPEGADAVLLQEDAVRNGDHLARASDERPASRWIRRKGFEFVERDVLLRAGTRIGAAQLALAIAAGHAQLRVGKQPKLALIESGDELALPGEGAGDRLPASNGAMLRAMAEPFAACHLVPPVPDRRDALRDALEAAMDCDVIATSGGASVGDHDLIRPVLEAWGADLAFWRIAMKPGKPLLVARKGRTLVLGLPGNPVSAFVTGYLFLLPLLRALAGACDPQPTITALPLATALPPGGNRTEFVRGRMTSEGVAPIDVRDSSALCALASADALIHRDIDAPAAPAGSMITAYPLGNGGSA